MYIPYSTVHAGRNIISSPATFGLLHLYVQESVPPRLAIHDVKEIHAAYRRAYVLSLLTWPRTCTHPRHEHRGSEAFFLSRATCGSDLPLTAGFGAFSPSPQLSIVGIVSQQCLLVILNFFCLRLFRLRSRELE